MALEQLYSHYKHPRTAILMGHARGVICLAAAQAGVERDSLLGHANQESAHRQRPRAEEPDATAIRRELDLADAARAARRGRRPGGRPVSLLLERPPTTAAEAGVRHRPTRQRTGLVSPLNLGRTRRSETTA